MTSIDLSHLGLIEITGSDAPVFLQNLCTNDIREITDQKAQLSGILSAKGRLLANFLVFKIAESYYLQLPLEMVEPTMKRFGLYIFRSKVSISDATGKWERTGFHAETFDDIPVMGVKAIEEGFLIRLSEKRYERLSSEKTPCDKTGSFWDLLEISEGIPAIYLPSRELFVPQMVNFDLVDAVSFKKGCYPGQEIVARTHYLGKIKRRMRLFSHGNPLRPGEEISAGATAVRSAASGDGEYHCLIVTQDDLPAQFKPLPLPYAIP